MASVAAAEFAYAERTSAGLALSPSQRNDLALEVLERDAPPSRAKAEQATAMRDLYGLLDSLSEPVFLLDARADILFRNQAGASFPCPGAPVPSSLLECEGELWKSARQLLERCAKGEVAAERKVYLQGTEQHWLVSVRELANSVPAARRFVLRFSDISAEERAQQDRAMTEFAARSSVLLAGAAHQAKNLLFGLSATLEALEAAQSPRLQGDAHVEHLKDGLARMQAMLKNVFAHGRPPGSATSFHASSMVREAIRGCTALATSREVNLCMGVLGDAPVVCDPQPLIQALENLIDNAVRYSPAGAVVTVDIERAAESTRTVEIRIADHGPGFHAGDAGKLFTPFFSRRSGGTGLGLAVARGIVEQHGGSIALANSTAGGAVVTVQLPALEDVPGTAFEVC